MSLRKGSRSRRRALPSSTEGATRWMSSLLPGSFELRAKQEPTQTTYLHMLMIAVVVLFTGFSMRLSHLQLNQGRYFSELANGNRIREEVVFAKRGQIYDRNGVLLAENVPSYSVVIEPYRLSRDDQQRQFEIAKVSNLLGIPADQIEQLINSNGLEHPFPVVLAEDIERNRALLLEANLVDLPGFSLQSVAVRRYRSEAGLAHILGYVGRVNEQDLLERQDILPTDFIGRDGVEYQYDQDLRGRNGVVKTEVDTLGRPVRVLESVPADPGTDITLSIDIGLQQTLASAVEHHMRRANVDRAAGVAMDLRTGEILASVSVPYYDNNQFARGIKADVFAALIGDSLEPLHNKVVSGGYPSGSTIKPMHIAGALQEGVVDENTTIVDNGFIDVCGGGSCFRFNGWNPNGLGPMNARRAVAMSSDIYFYTVGGGYKDFVGMGPERLTKYYKMFGYGKPTGIDLPGETAGFVPTPDWKEAVKGEPWYVGDTYNISIGQGDFLVSPLQLAVATGAVANMGKLIRPTVVQKIGDTPRQLGVVTDTVAVDAKNLQIAREGMKQVIGATASVSTFAGVPVPVAGKSGTAETDPTTGRRSHAWFAAFAPYDNPEIVMVVLLEEGEGGSQFAAPPIADALQYYYRR